MISKAIGHIMQQSGPSRADPEKNPITVSFSSATTTVMRIYLRNHDRKLDLDMDSSDTILYHHSAIGRAVFG